MNILVRELPRTVSERELMKLFQPFGTVKSLNIVIDPATGKSKGFGFVDMPVQYEAAAAIKALNGKLVGGARIRVKTTARQSAPASARADFEPETRFETRRPKYPPRAGAMAKPPARGSGGSVRGGEGRGSAGRGNERKGPARKGKR